MVCIDEWPGNTHEKGDFRLQKNRLESGKNSLSNKTHFGGYQITGDIFLSIHIMKFIHLYSYSPFRKFFESFNVVDY